MTGRNNRYLGSAALIAVELITVFFVATDVNCAGWRYGQDNLLDLASSLAPCG